MKEDISTLHKPDILTLRRHTELFPLASLAENAMIRDSGSGGQHPFFGPGQEFTLRFRALKRRSPLTLSDFREFS